MMLELRPTAGDDEQDRHEASWERISNDSEFAPVVIGGEPAYGREPSYREKPMVVNSRRALVGDVGGTNARFAVADLDDITISHFASFRCAMFASFSAAIKAYLATIPHRPPVASIAIAGPVSGEVFHLTNLSWSFTMDELRSATEATHIQLINDFEALALSLPHLHPDDLHKIGGGEPVEEAAKAVLGPGTGLGVAGLIGSASGWVAMPSEGGHISFAVEDTEELAILDHMMQDNGHVSCERLISGPGLVRAYQALAETGGATVGLRSASEIVNHALARSDPFAEEALGYFVRWLGRFAGDVALVLGARGGIYLGGGIAPKILDALTTGAFRTAFQSKGRLSSYLAPIPVYLIKAADAGLRGAAVALSANVSQHLARIPRGSA